MMTVDAPETMHRDDAAADLGDVMRALRNCDDELMPELVTEQCQSEQHLGVGLGAFDHVMTTIGDLLQFLMPYHGLEFHDHKAAAAVSADCVRASGRNADCGTTACGDTAITSDSFHNNRVIDRRGRAAAGK
jgi:hypothetical protein